MSPASISSLAVMVALGCGAGGHGTGSATLSNDDDYVAAGTALGDRFIAMLDADGGDCDKIADDLDRLRPDWERIVAYQKAHPGAKKKLDAVLKRKEPELNRAGEPSRLACQDNPKLLGALMRFNPFAGIDEL